MSSSSAAIPQYTFSPVLYPPLGTTTTIKCSPNNKTKLQFHALMTVSTASLPSTAPTVPGYESSIPAAHRFQVILWWSIDGRGIWRPAQFREVPNFSPEGSKLLDLSSTWFQNSKGTNQSQSRRRDHFVLDFEHDGTQPLQFCLKYMFADGPWLWEGARIGKSDGRVVFIPTSSRSPSPSLSPHLPLHTALPIAEIFPALPSTWTVFPTITSAQSSTTTLYYLTAPRTHELIPLGRPAALERWTALVKIATPWMGPTFGHQFFSCNRDALLLLLQRRDGRVVVLLPVTGVASLGGGTNYIISDDENKSEVVIRSLDDDFCSLSEGVEKKAGVIVAVGENADDAMDAAVGVLKKPSVGGKEDVSRDGMDDISSGWHVLNGSSGSTGTNTPKPLLSTSDSSARTKDLTSPKVAWETGLSYCTWNGLGWNLSEQRLLDALDELEKSGFQVCNLLIDDNWQTLEGRNYGSSGTWTRFEANEQFPNGLKGAVSRIREKYPKIEHIGVWHALHGYWDGITPNSPLTENYRTIQVLWRDNVKEQEKYLTMIHPSDIDRFYDDFYKFLSECGITGVKADVQSRIDELALPQDRAFLSIPYQNALAKAGAKYFDGRVIYCMAHIPQVLYHSLLDASLVSGGKVAKVVRTSDDFYPDVLASHAWHIYANAQNMILFSRFNILPDWDMFQTTLPPPYNGLHAAARCLSGGPIFITDLPGHTSPSTIASLSAISTEDRIVTLNPSSVAAPINPFMQYGEEKLCCVRNKMDWGAKFLGAFNVADKRVTELIPASTWLEEQDDEEMLVRSYASGNVHSVAKNGFLVAELPSGGWDVFTAFPIKTLSSAKACVAVLGLLDKITGAAAVNGWSLDEDEVDIEVDLIAVGVLGLYISDLPQRDQGDITVSINGSFLSGDVLKKEKTVLSIDLESVWKSLDSTSKRINCTVNVSLLPTHSSLVE